MGFVRKFTEMILESIREGRVGEIFEEAELAWRSGVVMGIKGWEEILTEENVEEILGMIEVVVET
ncbi:hypothetical protein FWD07_00605 [Candidatus Saccharibacteria bacterium]|nr:hypothetical protein [Candidatus Saccharibacteria bacterium]